MLQRVGVKKREGVCVCLCLCVVYSYHGRGCLKLVLFMIFGSSGLKIPEVLVFWDIISLLGEMMPDLIYDGFTSLLCPF